MKGDPSKLYHSQAPSYPKLWNGMGLNFLHIGRYRSFYPNDCTLDSHTMTAHSEDEGFSSPLLYPTGRKHKMKDNIYGLSPISLALRKVYIPSDVSYSFSILLRRKSWVTYPRSLSQEVAVSRFKYTCLSKAVCFPGKTVYFWSWISY